MVLDEALAQFDGLIHYAANCYAGVSRLVDVDDLYQEGCILLVKIWRRSRLSELHRTRLFKKSLFLMLHRLTYQKLRKARFNRTVGAVQHGDSDSPPTVDLDEIFGSIDAEILQQMFCREFVAELRRLLSADECRILDCMMDPTVARFDPLRDRSWKRMIARVLGRTTNEINYLTLRIRRRAHALVPAYLSLAA